MNIKLAYCFGIVFLAVFIWCDSAISAVSISQSVSKGPILIGDIITYNVTIKYQPHIRLIPPKIGQGLEAVSIHSYEIVEDKPVGEEWMYRIVYRVGIYQLEPVVISSINIYFHDNNVLHYKQSQSIEIKVQPMSGDQLEGENALTLFPPILPEYPMGWIILGVMSGGLGIIGIARIKIWWGKRFRPLNLGKYSPAKKSPEDVVFQRIDQWRNKQHLENNRIKLYYGGISHIFKAYLSQKYHHSFRDYTTTAIQKYLMSNHYNQEIVKRVNALLQQYDYIKFKQRINSNNHRDLHTKLMNTISYIKKHSYDT